MEYVIFFIVFFFQKTKTVETNELSFSYITKIGTNHENARSSKYSKIVSSY